MKPWAVEVWTRPVNSRQAHIAGLQLFETHGEALRYADDTDEACENDASASWAEVRRSRADDKEFA